eukprot:1526036-Amphidinium_carterae.1
MWGECTRVRAFLFTSVLEALLVVHGGSGQHNSPQTPIGESVSAFQKPFGHAATTLASAGHHIE